MLSFGGTDIYIRSVSPTKAAEHGFVLIRHNKIDMKKLGQIYSLDGLCPTNILRRLFDDFELLHWN